jgi:predicted PurR-regulated permease PerM
MKYILSLLLLSVFLMPTTHADQSQNIIDKVGKVFQDQTGLSQNNKNTNLATAQSANQTTNQDAAQASNNAGTKEVQTEQDKVVKNVSQATGQAAKKAGEALSSVGSQVGEVFQNLTGSNQSGNTSGK